MMESLPFFLLCVFSTALNSEVTIVQAVERRVILSSASVKSHNQSFLGKSLDGCAQSHEDVA